MNVINFPLRQQPEPPQPELPEINIDANFEEVYAPPEDIVCNDKCYKCSHVFEDGDHVWKIQDNAGYGSQLDGSHISICICDSCVVEILNK